jgi:hypothetical protein
LGVCLWAKWINVDKQLDEAFDLMKSWGVQGVKIDFMDRNDAIMVNFYERVAKKATECKMLVDFHGSYPNEGMRAKYPNLMTREGVVGLEYNKWSERCTPVHQVIIPYLRQWVGPMDFTPGIFVQDLAKVTDGRNNSWVNATIANQLGLYVTMSSPLQMAADLPEHYEQFMDAFQFIKDVDIDWIQSKYLLAEPGDYLVVARQGKKNGQWFVGGVTDDQKRTLDISFGFLEPGKTYVATIYRDADDADYKENPQAYVIEKKTVTSDTVLPLFMARGGGFAISLLPA